MSPELGEGANEKSHLERIQKITSNLVQQIIVKLRRIETFIKSGEWINDNKVAYELNQKMVNLTDQIIQLGKKAKSEEVNEKYEKIIKNLNKIETVVSKFLRREKLIGVQATLVTSFLSLQKSVRGAYSNKQIKKTLSGPSLLSQGAEITTEPKLQHFLKPKMKVKRHKPIPIHFGVRNTNEMVVGAKEETSKPTGFQEASSNTSLEKESHKLQKEKINESLRNLVGVFLDKNKNNLLSPFDMGTLKGYRKIKNLQHHDMILEGNHAIELIKKHYKKSLEDVPENIVKMISSLEMLLGQTSSVYLVSNAKKLYEAAYNVPGQRGEKSHLLVALGKIWKKESNKNRSLKNLYDNLSILLYKTELRDSIIKLMFEIEVGFAKTEARGMRGVKESIPAVNKESNEYKLYQSLLKNLTEALGFDERTIKDPKNLKHMELLTTEGITLTSNINEVLKIVDGAKAIKTSDGYSYLEVSLSQTAGSLGTRIGLTDYAIFQRLEERLKTKPSAEDLKEILKVMHKAFTQDVDGRAKPPSEEFEPIKENIQRALEKIVVIIEEQRILLERGF